MRARASNENAQARLVSLGVLRVDLLVQADFFVALTFACHARCAAAILLRVLADMVPLWNC